MLRVLLTLLIFTHCEKAFSQNTVCTNKLDSTGVIKIAKKKNAWRTDNWATPPSMKFDAQNCTWTVQSFKRRHTNKGNCKHTNGCTETTTVTLVIDATTKKVKSQKKQKELMPNYE